MQPFILWPTWLATRMFLSYYSQCIPISTCISIPISTGHYLQCIDSIECGVAVVIFFLWWFFLCFYILLFNLPFYYFIILFTAFVQILFKNKNSYIDILNFSFNMGLLVIQIYFYTYSQIVLLIYLTVEQKIKSTILKL